jgi:hypothetical protein
MGRAAQQNPKATSGSPSGQAAGFAAVFGKSRRGTGNVPDRATERPGPEAWFLRPSQWTVAGRLPNAAAHIASESPPDTTTLALKLDTCAVRDFPLIELRREADDGYHVHASNPRTGETPETMAGFNPLPESYHSRNWVLSPALASVLVEAWPAALIEHLNLDEAGDINEFSGRLQAVGLEYSRSAPRRLA